MSASEHPGGHGLELPQNPRTFMNRRRALGLMSGAGIAAALAGYGISAFDGESRHPYFDVRDYGAVGNGTTDDTAALQEAIAAAMPVSGTVFLPHGKYGISAELQLLGRNHSVTLVGEGPESSIIKALHSDGRVVWGGQVPTGPGLAGQTLWGRPGTSHGWGFDGNLIATRGLVIGVMCSYGVWQSIAVMRCNGDGVSVWSQNNAFVMVNSGLHAENGWTIDYGAQTNEFIQCHAAGNDGWGFEVRQSGGPGWGASAQPQSLRFVAGIVEQAGSPDFKGSPLGGFHIREGVDISFERFELVSNGSEGSLVLTPSTANGFVGRIVVRDCRVNKIYIDANSGGVAQSMGGTNEPLLLTGWNDIGSIVNGSTARIYDDSLGKLGSYTPEGTGAATSLRQRRDFR